MSRPDLSKSEKAIFRAILSDYNPYATPPVCAPEYSYIKIHSSYRSHTTISNTFKRLQDLGIIIVIKRSSVNYYYFTDLL